MGYERDLPADFYKGNWNYPTRMRFGAGKIKELPEELKRLGVKRPLLVTDPGLAKLPMIQEALAALKAAGLEATLYSEVKSNPVGKNVDDGVALYRKGKHDGVIAWGGGSALDAAKAIALMAGQKCSMWDLEDRGDNFLRADPNGIAPIVAVPTTAGTGSEVGRASVITDESDHTKKIIFHPKMQPSVVISDPELTVGLPPHITAATGMDALAHCLEAYCAPGFHPMADGIAVEGMRLVKEWLPVAVADGKDLRARAAMLAAASMGATAFQKGLGAIHALSHPVGAVFDTHHGLTNAVFMPYVLAFNRQAIDERLTRLAAWLGFKKPGYQAILDWTLELRQTFGMPHTLEGLLKGRRLDALQLEELSKMAAHDPSAGGNPLPVGAKELRGMFEASIEGRI